MTSCRSDQGDAFHFHEPGGPANRGKNIDRIEAGDFAFNYIFISRKVFIFTFNCIFYNGKSFTITYNITCKSFLQHLKIFFIANTPTARVVQ